MKKLIIPIGPCLLFVIASAILLMMSFAIADAANETAAAWKGSCGTTGLDEKTAAARLLLKCPGSPESLKPYTSESVVIAAWARGSQSFPCTVFKSGAARCAEPKKP